MLSTITLTTITPTKKVKKSCPNTPRKDPSLEALSLENDNDDNDNNNDELERIIIYDIRTPTINDELLENGLEPIELLKFVCFTPTDNINIIGPCFSTPTKDNNVKPVCPPLVGKYESPYPSYNNYTDCYAPSKKRTLNNGKSSAFHEVNNK